MKSKLLIHASLLLFGEAIASATEGRDGVQEDTKSLPKASIPSRKLSFGSLGTSEAKNLRALEVQQSPRELDLSWSICIDPSNAAPYPCNGPGSVPGPPSVDSPRPNLKASCGSAGTIAAIFVGINTILVQECATYATIVGACGVAIACLPVSGSGVGAGVTVASLLTCAAALGISVDGDGIHVDEVIEHVERAFEECEAGWVDWYLSGTDYEEPISHDCPDGRWESGPTLHSGGNLQVPFSSFCSDSLPGWHCNSSEAQRKLLEWCQGYYFNQCGLLNPFCETRDDAWRACAWQCTDYLGQFWHGDCSQYDFCQPSSTSTTTSTITSTVDLSLTYSTTPGDVEP